MDQFLAALLTPPALFFSLLLGAALLYWLLVIAGALDLDLFHLGHDGDGHHVGDGHGHHGHDGGDGHGMLHGVLEFLSVGKVPLTLVGTCLVLIGWLVCMTAQLTLVPLLAAALPAWLVALGLFTAALVVALPLTGFAMLPFRRAFAAPDNPGQKGGLSLVGQLARVTSRTVDPTFGTAVCTMDGSDIVLHVITGRGDLTLVKDQLAVIVHYDDERQVYILGPAPDCTVASPASVAAAPPPEPDFPVSGATSATAAPTTKSRPRLNA